MTSSRVRQPGQTPRAQAVVTRAAEEARPVLTSVGIALPADAGTSARLLVTYGLRRPGATLRLSGTPRVPLAAGCGDG